MSSQFKRGDWVVYMPGHAHGSLLHPDCERGTVTSVHSSGNPVFVVYGQELNAKATSPEDLVEATEYFGALKARERRRDLPSNGHGFRTYLGDGLFADFDGSQAVLSAEDGMSAHDVVYLDRSVLENLDRWRATKIAPLFLQSNEG